MGSKSRQYSKQLRNKRMTNLQNIITKLNKLENELWDVTNSRSISRGQKVIQSERIKLNIRRLNKEKDVELPNWLEE